jgi:hypothetical protein
VADALLDASVPVPSPLFDTILSLADAGMFEARWTETILDEVLRALERDLRLESGAARRRIDRMREVFPFADIAGFDHLTSSMPNHPGDRHVLAAAVHAGLTTIVTNNIRHFQPLAVERFGINAVTADGFLVRLHGEAPTWVVDTLSRQVKRYRVPAMSMNDLIARLGCPRFAARLVDETG